MKRLIRPIALAICLSLFGCDKAPRKEAVIVSDPYRNIDWTAVRQLRTGLHCHTANSTNVDWPNEGTTVAPRDMALKYKSLGYEALAITDHDFVTYPWSDYSLGDVDMLAIQGCEISKVENICSYFNDFRDCPDQPGVSVGFDACLQGIQDRGGISYLAHPARQSYTSRPANCIKTLRKFPSLKGIEVLNVGQYAKNNSVVLWDEILSELMPDRNVWGTSSDDAHGLSACGLGWTYLLCSEATTEQARAALSDGHTYFATKKEMKDYRCVPPRIASIKLDAAKGTLEIVPIPGGDIDEITVEWTSMGKVVFSGNKIDYRHTKGIDRYLRATLIGKGGRAYTQPWGIKIETE